MSLRRRLFLLLGGLICLLLVGQWLLFRSLTKAVTEDVRTVAFRVGEDILSGFSYRTESRQGGEASASHGAVLAPGTETHLVVVTSENEGAAGEAPLAGARAGAASVTWTSVDEPEAVEPSGKHRVLRREVHLKSPAPAAGVAGATSPTVAGVGSEGVPSAERPADGAAGPFLRKMVLETDAARDVLFVRGPAMKREIPIPRGAIAETLDRFGSRLLFGNLALLAAGLLAAAVVAHRLTRPLAGLTEAAERLGKGELGAEVAVPGGTRSPNGQPTPSGDRSARDDEIGRAIASFNRMSQRLAELDRENRRLASAEQLSELGEVARGLAHSLRNPLNALGLAIEQVGASPEVVEGSRRQIRRMDGALRSFLALASAGSAQAELVDVAQLAREVALEALQDGAGRVRIGVEIVAAPGKVSALSVVGVPAELKAVLQALVVNAVEASPAGGQVVVRLVRGDTGESDGVRVEIDDEGTGLPEPVRARLFEPHVTTKPHGSGMGLFLAHRLASGRYGGALRLEPRAEAIGGTRVTLEIGDRVR